MTPEQKRRYRPSSMLPPAWVCQDCGAAILAYDMHDRWHESLRDIASLAVKMSSNIQTVAPAEPDEKDAHSG